MCIRDRAKLGAWTKDQLVELGPTFVKLGQIVSTRPDLYPPEFTRQLESLQDDVPPIDAEYVDNILEKIPNFSYFDHIPFKSASIGQVHRARLIDGRDVVVKLKRPDIYNIMKYDTDNIIDIVTFLEKIGIDTGTSSGYILNESIEYLLSETDYANEIDNAKRMRTAFKKIKWVKIPKMYDDYCTNDMIVMEMVESEKLSEISSKKVNRKKVCEALISLSLIHI